MGKHNYKSTDLYLVYLRWNQGFFLVTMWKGIRRRHTDTLCILIWGPRTLRFDSIHLSGPLAPLWPERVTVAFKCISFHPPSLCRQAESERIKTFVCHLTFLRLWERFPLWKTNISGLQPHGTLVCRYESTEMGCSLPYSCLVLFCCWVVHGWGVKQSKRK